MAEVTFSDFAKLAKRQGHNPESLAEPFRSKIGYLSINPAFKVKQRGFILMTGQPTDPGV
jgi:hypothetical protein